jgi:hypothetical protein
VNDLSQEILKTLEDFRRRGTEERDSVTGETFFSLEIQRPVRRFPCKICFPDPNFNQPAVNFEKKHRLAGISGQYMLPEKITSEMLQAYALFVHGDPDMPVSECHERLETTWKHIGILNPALAAVLVDRRNTDSLFHAVMGVASAYNADDIEHFLTEKKRYSLTKKDPPGVKMHRSPAFLKLTDTFNKSAVTTGESLVLYWIASPQTLEKIETQFRPGHIRKNIPPAAGF